LRFCGDGNGGAVSDRRDEGGFGGPDRDRDPHPHGPYLVLSAAVQAQRPDSQPNRPAATALKEFHGPARVYYYFYELDL
jgi:hypothetical protein